MQVWNGYWSVIVRATNWLIYLLILLTLCFFLPIRKLDKPVYIATTPKSSILHSKFGEIFIWRTQHEIRRHPHQEQVLVTLEIVDTIEISTRTSTFGNFDIFGQRRESDALWFGSEIWYSYDTGENCICELGTYETFSLVRVHTQQQQFSTDLANPTMTGKYLLHHSKINIFNPGGTRVIYVRRLSN